MKIYNRYSILIYILLASLFHVPEVKAQSSEYLKDLFLDSMKNSLLIRNGKVEPYMNIAHEGTVYAYSKEFKKGELKYNGVLYKDQIINLNSFEDELVIKVPELSNNLILNKDLVDYFSYEDKHFVKIGDGQINRLKSGYYQVIYGGRDKIFKKIYKTHQTKHDKDLLQVINIFNTKEEYFLIKDGEAYTVRNTSSILKHYDVKRRSLSREISDFNTISNKDFLFSLLMKHIEDR